MFYVVGSRVTRRSPLNLPLFLLLLLLLPDDGDEALLVGEGIVVAIGIAFIESRVAWR
jgi:hypothetical protein